MDVACNGEFVVRGVLYCECGERVSRSRKAFYDEVGGLRYLPTGPQRCQAEQNGQEERLVPKKVLGASKNMTPGMSKPEWWLRATKSLILREAIRSSSSVRFHRFGAASEPVPSETPQGTAAASGRLRRISSRFHVVTSRRTGTRTIQLHQLGQ